MRVALPAALFIQRCQKSGGTLDQTADVTEDLTKDTEVIESRTDRTDMIPMVTI